MASKKSPRHDPDINPLAWMVTFSDLVTLLLTFFVMIIAITSMDPKIVLDRFGPALTEGGTGVLGRSSADPVFSLETLLEDASQLPQGLHLNQEAVKKILFSLDPDPTAETQNVLEEAQTVEVSLEKRGLVLKWDGETLFPEGRAVVNHEQEGLLKRLVPFLKETSLAISLEAYTDPGSALEGGETPAAYKLSFDRSKAVLDLYVALGLNPDRFRLGAYGPGPGEPPGEEEAPPRRRLEIVIYKP